MSDIYDSRRSTSSSRRSEERRGTSRRENGNRRAVPRRRTRKRPLIATLFVRLFQLMGTLLLIGLVTGSFLLGFAAFYIKTAIMPQTTLDLSAYTLNENSVIYYTDPDTGLYVEMATLVGEKNTEWVDLEDVPQNLIDAVVAIEDKRFWSHNGVDWRRTGYAVLHMLLGMDSTVGGSTITQQLIKNLTQYDDVTVTRKIKEIFTALELEKNYSKEEILELYLNLIYMGSGCYGVQSAAQTYFGKDVSELSLAECASLAGITNNPSLYGPNSDLRVTRYKCSACGEYTNNSKPDVCPDCGARSSFGEPEVWTAKDYNKKRQLIILDEMLDADGENGVSYITNAEYNQAKAETLNFVDSYNLDDEEDEPEESSSYSWYVETVIAEVKADLMEQTGLDSRAVNQLLYSGGLSIYTNYDPDVQAAVDEIYNDPTNLPKAIRTSKSGQSIKSAITVVDNQTGWVVAVAGDVGAKSGDLINNYATMAHQPGSSFKPLSVYAPALELGYITPATTIDDNPVRLYNDSAWPRNENSGYAGLISVQKGVADSRNTVAVRVLEMVTPQTAFEFVRDKFGITTLVEGEMIKGEWKTDIDYAPLALGGPTYGISTFEAAAAFATFPRNGLYTEPSTYSRVDDRNHAAILDKTSSTEQVISASTAYYMNNMLTNAVLNGTGSPAKISGMTVAGKTGTTQNSHARWFSGYTPYYTASVWVGYQYDESIPDSSNPAVIMWQKVMSLIHEDLPNTSFPQTVETVSRRICLDCGKLATSACEADIRGSRVQSFEFVSGDEPAESCTCHVGVRVCTSSPILSGDGESSGYYHRAGAYCPEETCKTIYLVDYNRELITSASEIGDYRALKSTYDSLSGGGVCTVHTEDWVEPLDPDEEGSEDPNGSEDPDASYDPNGSEDPDASGMPGWIWPWGNTEPVESEPSVTTQEPGESAAPEVPQESAPPESSATQEPEPTPAWIGNETDPEPAEPSAQEID